MHLNAEEPPLSLSFWMNSSNASPKKFGNISEAYQSRSKLIVRTFSTELAAFSTGFCTRSLLIAQGLWFSEFCSIELDMLLKAVLAFENTLHYLRNPLGWNDSHQGLALIDLISSALTATPSMCLPRWGKPLRIYLIPWIDFTLNIAILMFLNQSEM